MSMFAAISFILVVICVGVYAYLRSRKIDTQNSDGFFMGGRSLTGFTIASTIIMTNLSTEQIVGQNGQSFVAGMEVMAWEVTSSVAIVILALVFLPRYFRYGVDTISDFIEMRFDTFTKRLVSLLFIFTYVVSFLPVVLYSGALVFNKIFNVSEMLNISDMTAVILISTVIGLVGIIYLFIGGLSLSAHSDSIYGVGLIVGGLAIPALGLIIFGDGSFLHGFDKVVQNTPEKLNSLGAIDSKIVPWPTLFFGMFFNNLFFWCTNQMIVQKALAGKNLKEAQKGAMYVGTFKIFGALFLVFPGVLAFNMLGDKVTNPDNAYPMLVNEVLPEWAYGLFGAVIFGAILSSFVGSLNSTATLFSLDFYKSIINKEASNKQVSRIGRLVTVLVGVIVVIIAPMISLFPQGLYAVVQEFNGIYNMPLLVLVLVGFFVKRTSQLGAKVMFILHIVLYALSKVLITEIHFLYVLSVLFFVDLLIVMLFNKWKPSDEFDFSVNYAKVDITPWKHRYLVGGIIVLVVIGTYVLFSPLGLA
ncbi:solute:sodium symporter family transporter [Mammaliicoccus sciuri]|uniref:solute:sodium symporter family transporter n=2 Tax=Mammaliicoccus sciuri TaxID=1296 RepID=UPI000D1F9B4F|nr:solute:sodium symporter family transporter [Mammaliicoccus sciuri]MBN4910281.1 solute:sodium symporter family transporter [Staphylococcus sp. EG-SA-13]MCC2088787.1 solute:sodium symporter family transporter [Mammaliicoccus sciuri]MCD8807803.1 solute:sodium symporter family transporter [Mammaliicoccus sciuri]MCD8893227.1 solute:sodium symporter family transporter [Mammaliicoccus sciuri]MCD8911483.1 solute:sodium symporter family transporter [Mammaliicoccus sciuri]